MLVGRYKAVHEHANKLKQYTHPHDSHSFKIKLESFDRLDKAFYFLSLRAKYMDIILPACCQVVSYCFFLLCNCKMKTVKTYLKFLKTGNLGECVEWLKPVLNVSVIFGCQQTEISYSTNSCREKDLSF